MGKLEGTLKFAKYGNLYSFTNVNLTVDNISGVWHPDVSGVFSIDVPVGTSTNSREYTLRVSGKGFVDQAINNIVAPLAGSVNVELPDLQPNVVTVVGSVVNPYTAVNAIVVGTGLEGGITGGGVSCPSGTLGQYSIDGVPTYTDVPLKITVMVYSFDPANCASTLEYRNSSSTEFTALNNGSGVFRASPISSQ
jgi:hypothetical protein